MKGFLRIIDVLTTNSKLKLGTKRSSARKGAHSSNALQANARRDRFSISPGISVLWRARARLNTHNQSRRSGICRIAKKRCPPGKARLEVKYRPVLTESIYYKCPHPIGPISHSLSEFKLSAHQFATNSFPAHGHDLSTSNMLQTRRGAQLLLFSPPKKRTRPNVTK